MFVVFAGYTAQVYSTGDYNVRPRKNQCLKMANAFIAHSYIMYVCLLHLDTFSHKKHVITDQDATPFYGKVGGGTSKCTR